MFHFCIRIVDSCPTTSHTLPCFGPSRSSQIFNRNFLTSLRSTTGIPTAVKREHLTCFSRFLLLVALLLHSLHWLIGHLQPLCLISATTPVFSSKPHSRQKNRAWVVRLSFDSIYDHSTDKFGCYSSAEPRLSGRHSMPGCKSNWRWRNGSSGAVVLR